MLHSDRQSRLQLLVKTLKDEKGFNKSQVSEKLGIKIQGLSNYINGVTPIGHKFADKIEEVFGVNRKWVLCESNIMYVSDKNSAREELNKKGDKNENPEPNLLNNPTGDMNVNENIQLQKLQVKLEIMQKMLNETLEEVNNLVNKDVVIVPGKEKKKSIQN